MNRNDKLLDNLESSIQQLKLEYDIFFNGGSDQFPQKFHEQLAAEVKRMFNTPFMSYAQRFRLTSLAARLTSFNDLWQRNLKLREQGRPLTYMPHVEKPRRPPEVSMGPKSDRESIEHLYQEYCRAREQTGKTSAIDPLRFEELITSKVRAIREQKACEEVVFVVSIEGGEVQLKARPKR